ERGDEFDEEFLRPQPHADLALHAISVASGRIRPAFGADPAARIDPVAAILREQVRKDALAAIAAVTREVERTEIGAFVGALEPLLRAQITAGNAKDRRAVFTLAAAEIIADLRTEEVLTIVEPR